MERDGEKWNEMDSNGKKGRKRERGIKRFREIEEAGTGWRKRWREMKKESERQREMERNGEIKRGE